MHRFIFFALLLASSAYASDDPCICPDVYEPVWCVHPLTWKARKMWGVISKRHFIDPSLRSGYDNKTYSNACQARCNGVGVKMEGECGCTCYYLVYAPVCGMYFLLFLVVEITHSASALLSFFPYSMGMNIDPKDYCFRIWCRLAVTYFSESWWTRPMRSLVRVTGRLLSTRLSYF